MKRRATSNRRETALPESEFVRDVRAGLSDPDQKHLSPKYFYDDVGSALFEVITRLPEYGLARADERIIERHAGELVARLSPGTFISELGSGNGTKTRRILSSSGLGHPTQYFPIDVSQGALERCQTELSTLDHIRVRPVADTYLNGLTRAIRMAPADAQLLLLFLGSTIGNFPRERSASFLAELRQAMRSGDRLLLGTDLVKPVAQLLAAYDDPTGVTAAFNKNVLARINRELGGNFDLRQFTHVATWNPDCRRIEIHLRSVLAQRVTIPAAALTIEFRESETIWTESSHKFDRDEVVAMGRNGGFRCEAQWIDEDWPFAETLLVAV
jgi:L-histidine Nalpha-methyltransferase